MHFRTQCRSTPNTINWVNDGMGKVRACFKLTKKTQYYHHCHLQITIGNTPFAPKLWITIFSIPKPLPSFDASQDHYHALCKQHAIKTIATYLKVQQHPTSLTHSGVGFHCPLEGAPDKCCRSCLGCNNS